MRDHREPEEPYQASALAEEEALEELAEEERQSLLERWTEWADIIDR